MPPFEPGNPHAKTGGRPRGSKNRLCRAIVDDLLNDWAEGGAAAIKLMRMERPHEYVRAAFSILPKEVLFESAMSDLSDEQLDLMIDRLKQQVLAEQQEPILIEHKSAEPVNGD